MQRKIKGFFMSLHFSNSYKLFSYVVIVMGFSLSVLAGWFTYKYYDEKENVRLVKRNKKKVKISSAVNRILIMLFGIVTLSSAYTNVSLELKWKHQFQFAGYYMAKEKGFYKDAGLDVEIIEGVNKDVLSDIQDRTVDFGVAASGLVRERVLGRPFVALAVIFQNSPLHLLVREDSNITKLSDFIGKRVMLHKERMQSAELLVMFRNNGIALDDLNIIDTSFDIDSLINRETDAFNAYIPNEPYYLKQQGIKYRLFHPKNYGVNFYSDILFTSEAMIQKSPKVVKSFREASLKGWNYAFDHIDETIALILKKYNTQNKTKEELYFEAFELKKLTLAPTIKIGHMNEEHFKAIAQFLKGLKFIESDVEIDLKGFLYESEPPVDHTWLKWMAAILGLVLVIMSIFMLQRFKYTRRLQKSAKELTNIARNIPGVIYTFQLFPDGRSCFPFASDHIYDIYGVTAQEVQKDATKVFGVLHPEDFGHVNKTIQISFEELTLWEDEYRVIHPDKGLIWVKGIARPEKQSDGSVLWYGYIYDVTARKEIEAGLEQERNFSTSLIENVPAIIVTLNKKGEIVLFNHYIETLTGYSSNEVIGKDWFSTFLPKEHAEETKKVFIQAFDDIQTIAHVNPILAKDGTQRVIEWYDKTLKDEENNTIALLSFGLDISDRLAMQKELKKKEELMLSQSRQAAMGDMIAMIAHQWRQPLTVVSMAINNLKVDMALDETITTEQLDKMSDEILNQIMYLSKTIDDFRSFFLPNQKKTETTLCKVLDDTMNIIGKSLENNNIEVKINAECKQKIKTYPNELIQVLLNLISNAKYAVQEFPKTDAKIVITITGSQKEVSLTLCDNGGGIPEDILSRLGEPYISSKVQSGTGLGIYMSKTIIEKHLLGRLSWENKDVGACFRIDLPVK